MVVTRERGRFLFYGRLCFCGMKNALQDLHSGLLGLEDNFAHFLTGGLTVS